jgi:GNAT superfamily N-acetyltransferase
MPDPSFRPFQGADVDACIALFDANCPRYFAESERQAYMEFLRSHPAGYQLCIIDGRVAGAFGVRRSSTENRSRIEWVIIDPEIHGAGIGSLMIKAATHIAVMDHHSKVVEVTATQKSAPFFARFGAHSINTRWSPTDDRTLEVDMEMPL